MQSQDEALGTGFRKQLAACVRSIQWNYAIFWSLSTNQERLLEWNAGFYNGDIKTRKTTQPTDCKNDQMGLHRSEQLRELYESLSTVDSNEQSQRPSASLSPEDLTDAEWYYMVCMSFTFNLGNDMPGKVYEQNKPIWLSNAQFVESRTFSRYLLAKSAFIQTVLGIPFMNGVLELGTSDLVLENPVFVQSITNSFWEYQDPVSTTHSSSSSPLDENEDKMCDILDHIADVPLFLENHPQIADNDSQVFPFDVDSFAPNMETDLIYDNATDLHPSICDKIVSTSEFQSNFCDDHLKIAGLQNSLNSSEYFPWSFAQSILPSPRGERVNGSMIGHLQEDNYTKAGSFCPEGDGSHYASTLSAILGSLKQQSFSPGLPFESKSSWSSFKAWKRGSRASNFLTRTGQNILKKILIDRKWMHSDRLEKLPEDHATRSKTWKTEGDDASANHVLSERRRREKLNEKFLALRSLVPSISKVDKTSILADTIEYLKELEKRVEELECCREEGDSDLARTKRKHPDIAEKTSDNYGNNGLADCRRPSSTKRKVSKLGETEDVDINITVIEKVVLVEMQCPWRDSLLLDIMEALNNLHLDAQSVQSSIFDGILAITLRLMIMREIVPSPGVIKRAIQRIVGKIVG